MANQAELELLYDVTQILAKSKDVSVMLQESLDIIDQRMAFERGTITLKQPKESHLRIIASKGLTPEEEARGQYEIGIGITGKVASEMEAKIIPNIANEPDFLGKTQAKRDVDRAFICVPIIRQDTLVGTLSIDRPSTSFEELADDKELLLTLANILGEAVENLQSQIAERNTLIEENRLLRQELGEQFRPNNIIGNCASMRHVYNQIAQVANSPANVLIRGESGTGKELVARALHYGSDRRNGPFVCVNIAALPESLVESELFGHEKGAFTGALQQRIGRFEQADGGTLFLDEIGDISPAVQVRLLRVLQERQFERVGGNQAIHVNVRILAATSRNLEELIEKGTFREDLYYRLNIFPICMPPLRDRKSDIILLADFFLAGFNKKYNKNVKRISTPAINMMVSYFWPGNVRELENCVEHAVLTSNDDVVHGFNLPPSLQTAQETHTEFVSTEGLSLETMLSNYEREIIVDSLKNHRGNCAAAARTLNTTQRKFNYRIKRLNIDPRKYKGIG
ncbi:MAG: sigma 54-interacting transcriptional regulator [Lentisphaeria bacterium]|nr:sigma 54-interacting transcriptional regulator [Lentisphaeria bacterium]